MAFIIAAANNLVIIKRWNDGFLGDTTYTFLVVTFYEISERTFNYLPFLVLFTKLTPHRVETTVLAFLTGAHNFSATVGSPLLGSLLGTIVGVNDKELDDYYILIII